MKFGSRAASTVSKVVKDSRIIENDFEIRFMGDDHKMV